MRFPGHQKGSIPCGNTEEHHNGANETYLSPEHAGIQPILLLKDDWLMLSEEKCTKQLHFKLLPCITVIAYLFYAKEFHAVVHNNFSLDMTR